MGYNPTHCSIRASMGRMPAGNDHSPAFERAGFLNVKTFGLAFPSGTSAMTVVHPPGVESTRNVPPIISTRSLIP